MVSLVTSATFTACYFYITTELSHITLQRKTEHPSAGTLLIPLRIDLQEKGCLKLQMQRGTPSCHKLYPNFVE